VKGAGVACEHHGIDRKAALLLGLRYTARHQA